MKSTQTLEPKDKKLTRDKIIECGHSTSVQDVLEIIATDQGFNSVDTNCLIEFTSLYFADLSENYLAIEDVAYLPVLKELNISCNHIRFITIPEDGFPCLEVRSMFEHSSLSGVAKSINAN